MSNDNNNKIYKFFNEIFGELKCVSINGDAYFCLADICRAIGYANIKDSMSDILEKIDNEVKTWKLNPNYDGKELAEPYYKIPTEIERTNNSNGTITTVKETYNMIYIHESYFYLVLFNSRKKTSEVFQDWICTFILPSIHKLGFDRFENVLSNELIKKQNLLPLLQNDNMSLRLANSEEGRKSLGRMSTTLDRLIIEYNTINSQEFTEEEKRVVLSAYLPNYDPNINFEEVNNNLKRKLGIRIYD